MQNLSRQSKIWSGKLRQVRKPQTHLPSFRKDSLVSSTVYLEPPPPNQLDEGRRQVVTERSRSETGGEKRIGR
jgi:hypothetical protein